MVTEKKNLSFMMTKKKKVSRVIGALLLMMGVLSIAACQNPVGPKGKKPVDPKVSLNTKITEAETLVALLTQSADGTDVVATQYWVTSMHELETALETARIIAADPKATTQQIKLALEELTRAYDKMNETKQLGTKEAGGPIDLVDKDALKAKITEAQELDATVEGSEDGTDVVQEKFWVSVALKQSLTDALAAANTVANDSNATEQQVASALTVLTEAYNAVNAAKKQGTSNVDKDALKAKIAEARTLDGKLEASVDGTDVFKEKYWVSAALKSSLTGALAAAQAVNDNANATEQQVANALKELSDAYAAADAAKQPGTSNVDKSGLREKIAEAKEKLKNVRPAEDGLQILASEYWAKEAAIKALEAVVAEAEVVEGKKNATQQEVSGMRDTLLDAINGFKPQPGLVRSGVFTVTFEEPANETITLGPDQTQNWAAGTLTVTVQEDFENAAYEWYIDGIKKDGEDGRSITLSANTFSVGTHRVTLKVMVEGVPYSKTLIFTIN